MARILGLILLLGGIAPAAPAVGTSAAISPPDASDHYTRDSREASGVMHDCAIHRRACRCGAPQIAMPGAPATLPPPAVNREPPDCLPAPKLDGATSPPFRPPTA